MSKLSSFLEKKVGISKGVQKGITAVVKPIVAPLVPVAAPIAGAISVFEAAQKAAQAPSPFTGVVPPDPKRPEINDIFGLKPIGPSAPMTTYNGRMPGVTGGSSSTASSGDLRGYHLNKHALPACKSHGAVPARSIWVRNRHRNPANGAAIRRAASRLKSAEKLFRKVLTVQGKHHGTIKPKSRKR